MEPDIQKQIIEALIIASDEPISDNRIVAVLEDVTPGTVRKAIDSLNEEYENQRRGFFIAKVAGGYQINTRKDLAPWIKKLFKGRMKSRLTQASLETLAIIVFRQPINRVEVDAIRGVNSGGVVKNLLERNLITIVGRDEGPGKPLLYGTTKEFLEYLGVNDIKELPKPKEIKEIMGKLESERSVSDDIMQALTDTGSDQLEEELAAEDGELSEPGEQTETPLATHEDDDAGSNGKVE